MPDLAVLPGDHRGGRGGRPDRERARIPVVPRDGGTGLTDGAVPLRRGIVVDVKRMNEIHEIDLENRTVTVGTGINMLKLNEELARHGLIYPDDPASYPCSLVGGRIGTSGWSLIGSRYGHTRDLVLSFDFVLPTGEIIHVGDGGGAQDHQVAPAATSSSTCSWATRARSASPRGRRSSSIPKPEAELSPVLGVRRLRRRAIACTGALARAGVATFAGAVLFDEWKVAYLRRDDEAYIPQPTDVRALVCAVMYGYEDEVRAGGKRLFRVAKRARRPLPRRRDLRGRLGGASRPLRDAAARPHEVRPGGADELALRGRRRSTTRSCRPSRKRGTRSSPDLRRRTDVFDDWGMFAYTSADTGADYLTEIDVGIWEQQLDDDAWALWVEAKRDIAAASLAHGGTISACHGVVPRGRGRPGAPASSAAAST